MLELTAYGFEILISGTLIAMCAAIALQRTELVRLRTMVRCERADRRSLENDVVGLLACSKNIGKRVLDQDARQSRLLKKLDVIDLSNETEIAPSYKQVRKLIEQGLSIDEVADICDLRRGEVELLAHVASYRTAA